MISQPVLVIDVLKIIVIFTIFKVDLVILSISNFIPETETIASEYCSSKWLSFNRSQMVEDFFDDGAPVSIRLSTIYQ